MKPREDAFGRALLDYVEGVSGFEIIERDDGYVETSGGPAMYLSPYRTWPAVERRALRLVRGRVLDVGAGLGRVALHLQEKGHEVVAIDVSPLAVEACRRRGVRDARVVALNDVDESLGLFDTILMYGNNFGLVGSRANARRLLRRFLRLTAPRGRVVAETLDPYATDNSDHLEYHERNRRRRRMPGQIRIRVRYRRLATPWLDLLLVSPDEMHELVGGSGRVVRRLVMDGGPLYVAVLEKEGSSASRRAGG
ncbi:MAG TPA: methyltransferase domain-containing protein [Gaiellaceae bacterium]|nr:methyltransferase domain-containing protein [Gaiellaceae bacterium]